MNAVEILKAARELIAKPENWTQDYAARDENGCQTYPEGEQACKWCALGAIWRIDRLNNHASFDHVSKEGHKAEDALACHGLKETHYHSVAALNDSSDHDTVLRMYDRALAAVASA